MVAGALVAAVWAGNGATGKGFADPLQTPSAQRIGIGQREFQALERAGKRLVAVGQRGLVALSDDGGQQWSQRVVPVQVDLVAVDFLDERHGWATGHDGVVLHTADGGDTWVVQFDGRQGAALAQWYTPQQDLDASGEYAAQIERNFGQGPWLPLLDVHFADTANGLALGSFGMLLSTRDGGSSWQPALHMIDNPDYLHLNAIERTEGAVLIASERGTVFRSDAAGRFHPVATGHGGTFFSLASNGSTVLAGGLRGVVYASHDAGLSWQRVDSGLGQTVSAIRWIPSRQRFVLVTIGGEVASADAQASRFEPVGGFNPGILTGVIDAGGQLLVGGIQGLQLGGLDVASGDAR